MNFDFLLSVPRFASLICGVAAIFPCARAGSIAQSAAFPVVNQAVTLTVSADLIGTPISVAGPLGNSVLTPDGQGLVVWTPVRYGKYTLTCGDATSAIWVTARPMKFHWWSCTQAQKNVTEVMEVSAAWEARGVSQVQWTGGEAYSRGVDGHNWTTASEWYNGWNYAYSGDGMALDEIFCNDVAPMPAILDAVTQVRQAKGPAYSINVWSAGFGSNFAAGAAKLKASNATVLIEDYYGNWADHKSRWDAVRSYGLQNQAISGIWPGTTNLTNEAQIRADVALVRLAEPNANGIAMFAPTATNYTPNNLATLLNDCDKAIEDYYLKPLIHLSVTPSEQLVVWNLGNEDAAGFSLQLLNGSGSVVQTIDLSALVANGKQTLAIPAGAVNGKVINPPGTANLYTGNSQYSNGLFPLLVPGRYTWTNANGDNLWSTFSNWNPNGPPSGGIDGGSYAYFTNGGTNVTALGGETGVGGVQFTSAGWTINGNATTQDFYTYGITSAGAGTNTINIGISARDVVPASFNVGQDNTLVVNGLIGAVRNNGGLLKSGAGTLTVNYANTFTGGTSVNAGTLRIGGAGTLGAGSYAGAITNNGALVYASTANQTFSGNISGTGSLTHAGAGTLTLSGNNSYSGATTVNAGKLVFSKTSTGQPGSTVFTVNPGATLQLNNTGATWDGCASNVTVNGGTASLGGTGTVVYYGAGSINMTGGTLTFANNWAPYGNFRVTTHASPATATVNGTAYYYLNPAMNFIVDRGTAASDLNVTLALGGTGALTKSGAGVLTLSAACNYSGVTGVNGGTLIVNGSLGNSTTTVAPTGSLGGTGSLAGAVTLNGTLAPGSNGIGNLTINNTLTLSSGSQLAWEVSNWTGTAGDGWDKATVASLTLTATPLNPIMIRPKDLAMANFTEAGASFLLVQTTSGITGFSADQFTVDTSGLTTPKGTWAVQKVDNNLVLAYTANPDANANGILDFWEITSFGNAAAGANQANADADNDGICNLLEYALNRNPIVPDVSPLNVDQETLVDGQHLRLTVPKNPAATNLIYIVESGGALHDWSAANTVIESNTATELMVRDAVPMASEPSRFIRLRVQTAQ